MLRSACRVTQDTNDGARIIGRSHRATEQEPVHSSSTGIGGRGGGITAPTVADSGSSQIRQPVHGDQIHQLNLYTITTLDENTINLGHLDQTRTTLTINHHRNRQRQTSKRIHANHSTPPLWITQQDSDLKGIYGGVRYVVIRAEQATPWIVPRLSSLGHANTPRSPCL